MFFFPTRNSVLRYIVRNDNYSRYGAFSVYSSDDRREFIYVRAGDVSEIVWKRVTSCYSTASPGVIPRRTSFVRTFLADRLVFEWVPEARARYSSNATFVLCAPIFDAKTGERGIFTLIKRSSPPTYFIRVYIT